MIKNTDVIIGCEAGSPAEAFAIANGIKFEIVGSFKSILLDVLYIITLTELCVLTSCDKHVLTEDVIAKLIINRLTDLVIEILLISHNVVAVITGGVILTALSNLKLTQSGTANECIHTNVRNG